MCIIMALFFKTSACRSKMSSAQNRFLGIRAFPQTVQPIIDGDYISFIGYLEHNINNVY